MKYKIRFVFSVMLFFSFFANHICAQNLIRPGYGEFKMINSQSTFTGNIAIEGLPNPEKYKNKKFKVFFIKPENQDVIKKTYISKGLEVRKSDEYYYSIVNPDLIISPYSKKDKEIAGNYFNFLVFGENAYIEKIKVFNRDAKILKPEIQIIKKIFNAEFMNNFPDYVYEDNLKYDVPLISVRFSTSNWLLVDFYILKKGVDYGYGFFVPSSHIEKQDNTNFGQYLYNRKTGDTIFLKKSHLIGGSPPSMISGKDKTYLSCYIKVGKSYGHDEIFELENNKVKIVFAGSSTGS